VGRYRLFRLPGQVIHYLMVCRQGLPYKIRSVMDT
jgi:hypothetical protein